MTHSSLSPADRASLEQVLRAGPLNPQGNAFGLVTLPASQPFQTHSGPPTVPGAVATSPGNTATSFPPGSGGGPSAPTQLWRCIRTGCTHYGTATTSTRCLSCGTATQRIHE